MIATRPGKTPWPGLLLVALLALAVRVPALPVAAETYRTSEAFAGEEAENLRLSTGMVHKQQIVPHAYEYPSLFYDLSAAVEWPLSRVAPGWRIYLIAVRCLSLAFGVATVLLVGLIANRLGGPWAALLAASLVALDGTLIEISTMAKPNAAQVAFVTAGALALVELAGRPRLRTAILAAALFALAAASKWLGALGLVGLGLAAALALPVSAEPGGSRWGRWITELPRARVRVIDLVTPLAVFGAVFLLFTPGVLLTPKEFGYGLGQVFFAQAAHRRPLPATVSLFYLARSMGPLAILLATGGLVWAIGRLRRWDGSAAANGIVLLLAWAMGYGALVLFAFARLPSYVDLWVPPLAALAGCAWVGDQGMLRRPGARVALLTAAAIVGLWAHGADGLTRGLKVAGDSRQGAARWLETHAASADTVLADEGILVPDRLANVRWNWWGTPPRAIYDETLTWGRDPVWPTWGGGHRRLIFENAKWSAPETLLARRPHWVVTSHLWSNARREGGSSFDQRLADGSAGYRERVRLVPDTNQVEGWSLVLRGPRPPVVFTGLEIWIYEREAVGGGPPAP
jgi:4-amino-4-deoxy-L-arabinose transferase-like glycosyltransferase